MLKTVNPEVVKVVGVMSAMVFQHICYWMQTQSVDVVFRTNKELSSDLENSVSEQQIQRAKKKLIEAGLIKTSFENNCKWIRTTYYRLTDLGKKLLLSVKTNIAGVTQKGAVKPSEDTSAFLRQKEIDKKESKTEGLLESGTYISQEELNRYNSDLTEQNRYENKQGKQQWIPKSVYAQKMKEKREKEKNEKEFFIPKSMRDSFEQAGKPREGIVKGIPESLLGNPLIARMLKKSE